MEEHMALLLGADLGDPRAQVDMAITRIGERVGMIKARSRDHWTLPWGFEAEGLFLNVALLVATEHTPQEVLARCSAIEVELGRQRQGTIPASRTMDIDILLFGERIIDEPGLQVPHPRMGERRFALAPLADIAPMAQVPGTGCSVLALLDAIPRP